jgi:hypothetical protein
MGSIPKGRERNDARVGIATTITSPTDSRDHE